MKGTKAGRSKKYIMPVVVLLSLAVGFASAGLWFTRAAGREPGVASAYPPSDLASRAMAADYSPGTISNATDLSTLQSLQEAFRSVAATVLPTVVEIDVVDVVKQQVPGFTNPFEFFFGPQGDNPPAPQEREFRQQGLGSGVIVRHTGSKVYVLTNNHVAGFTDYIQTDAAINQGNSGGALVNIYGQVVGINTWIASPSGGNVGLGFAIPVNNAKKAIDDFITKGKIEYGWLGVSMGGVSAEGLKDLKLDDPRGALVYGVFRDSPADKAGVLPGDFITEVNGEGLKDTSELLLRIGNLEPGSKTELGIIRYGQPLQLTVKITARETEQDLAASSGKLWPGFSVVPLTEDIRAQLNLPKSSGRLVIGAVEQGGYADVAGMKSGDIIAKVNGQGVSTVLDFYKAFNGNKSREILFAVERQNTELVIGLVR